MGDVIFTKTAQICIASIRYVSSDIPHSRATIEPRDHGSDPWRGDRATIYNLGITIKGDDPVS